MSCHDFFPLPWASSVAVILWIAFTLLEKQSHTEYITTNNLLHGIKWI